MSALITPKLYCCGCSREANTPLYALHCNHGFCRTCIELMEKQKEGASSVTTDYVCMFCGAKMPRKFVIVAGEDPENKFILWNLRVARVVVSKFMNAPGSTQPLFNGLNEHIGLHGCVMCGRAAGKFCEGCAEFVCDICANGSHKNCECGRRKIVDLKVQGQYRPFCSKHRRPATRIYIPLGTFCCDECDAPPILMPNGSLATCYTFSKANDVCVHNTNMLYHVIEQCLKCPMPTDTAEDKTSFDLAVTEKLEKITPNLNVATFFDEERQRVNEVFDMETYKIDKAMYDCENYMAQLSVIQNIQEMFDTIVIPNTMAFRELADMLDEQMYTFYEKLREFLDTPVDTRSLMYVLNKTFFESTNIDYSQMVYFAENMRLSVQREFTEESRAVVVQKQPVGPNSFARVSATWYMPPSLIGQNVRYVIERYDNEEDKYYPLYQGPDLQTAFNVNGLPKKELQIVGTVYVGKDVVSRSEGCRFLNTEISSVNHYDSSFNTARVLKLSKGDKKVTYKGEDRDKEAMMCYFRTPFPDMGITTLTIFFESYTEFLFCLVSVKDNYCAEFDIHHGVFVEKHGDQQQPRRIERIHVAKGTTLTFVYDGDNRQVNFVTEAGNFYRSYIPLSLMDKPLTPAMKFVGKESCKLMLL